MISVATISLCQYVNLFLHTVGSDFSLRGKSISSFFSPGDVTAKDFEQIAKAHGKWDPLNPSMFVQLPPFRKIFHFTQLGQDFAPPEIEQRLNTFFKFIFVRNPWVRLLSAFRDTYESTKPNQTNQRLYF